MRFYDAEEWLSDQLDKVPWRWILLPLAAWMLVSKGVEWLFWHGY